MQFKHSLLFIFFLTITLYITTINAKLAPIANYSRVAYVDIDPLSDPDADQELRNMQDAVKHIVALGANTVFIQAYRDYEGHTRVSTMYYPNTNLGVHNNRNSFKIFADLLAAHDITIGAWLPILSFDIDHILINNKAPEYVLTWNETTNIAEKGDCTKVPFYCRLTPFNKDNYDWVLSLYKDLLTAYPNLAIINGHDDAAMNANQDFSQSALNTAKANGLPDTINELRSLPWDGADNYKWSYLKSSTMTKFYSDIIKELQKIKPTLKSARNFYINAFALRNETSDQGAVRWLAQSCKDLVDSGLDYIAPEVFPYMEEAVPTPNTTIENQFNTWMDTMINILKECAPLDKFQICLQARNWRNGQVITAPEFENWAQRAYDLGAYNIGFYPTSHWSDSISPPATPKLYNLLTAQNRPVDNNDDDDGSGTNPDDGSGTGGNNPDDNCTTKTDCGDSQFCDTTTKKCRSHCISNDECGNNFKCDNGECKTSNGAIIQSLSIFIISIIIVIISF